VRSGLSEWTTLIFFKWLLKLIHSFVSFRGKDEIGEDKGSLKKTINKRRRQDSPKKGSERGEDEIGEDKGSTRDNTLLSLPGDNQESPIDPDDGNLGLTVSVGQAT